MSRFRLTIRNVNVVEIVGISIVFARFRLTIRNVNLLFGMDKVDITKVLD